MSVSFKIKFALVAAVLSVAAGVAWWKFASARREAEQEIARLAVLGEVTQREMSATRTRVAAAKRRQTELAQTRDQPPPAKPAAASASAPRPGSAGSLTELISHDPAAEVLMLRWQREVAALEFGPFFRLRNLSADQMRRFQDDWARHTERIIDLNAAGRLPNADQAAIKALRDQANAASEAAFIEIFGADTYRDFREFQKTLPLRNIVVLGFAGAAALEGVPITAEQGQRLYEAGAAAAGISPTSGMPTGSLRTLLDWDRLDAAAQQILTPAQYALFTTNAAPSGFDSRWASQLQFAVRRAHEADVAAGVSKPAP